MSARILRDQQRYVSYHLESGAELEAVFDARAARQISAAAAWSRAYVLMELARGGRLIVALSVLEAMKRQPPPLCSRNLLNHRKPSIQAG